jgi:hypothetical protein
VSTLRCSTRDGRDVACDGRDAAIRIKIPKLSNEFEA